MDQSAYQVHVDHEETYWWFKSRRTLFLSQMQRASDEFHSRTPLEILDYGCGSGYNLTFLSDFGKAIGGDIFKPWLENPPRARQIPRIHVDHDAAEYRERFDIVTALDVLEHMDDDVEGLKKILAFAKPNGQLILTVPAYQCLWGGEDVLSHHKRRYTQSSLAACVRSAGAEMLFSSYFNMTVLPLVAGVIWGKRLFSRRKSQESNVTPLPGWLNELLYRITDFEATQVGRQRWRSPMGASIICRLRKKTNA
jgi:SAM-dependent methyltransferase